MTVTRDAAPPAKSPAAPVGEALETTAEEHNWWKSLFGDLPNKDKQKLLRDFARHLRERDEAQQRAATKAAMVLELQSAFTAKSEQYIAERLAHEETRAELSRLHASRDAVLEQCAGIARQFAETEPDLEKSDDPTTARAIASIMSETGRRIEIAIRKLSSTPTAKEAT